MRVVLAILLAGGVAAASPRDYDAAAVTQAIARDDVVALRAMVFATKPADRVRVLDALVRLGKLAEPARVPATAAAASELAKLVAGNARAAKLFAISTCSLQSVTATEVVLRCEPRGCEGACGVIRGEATVRVTGARWSIEGLAVRAVGDTGECGCCM